MSDIQNIKSLPNSILISHLKSKTNEERKLLNEILDLLSEVSSRRLYLQMAYPSLFEFCVGELGYSRASAYQRVEALKLLNSLSQENQKEIKSKIQTGTLNLTHLTQAQSFFKIENKENKKNYSTSEKTEILYKLENKSKLDSEKELVKISPMAIPQKIETLRYLTENKVEIKMTMDAGLVADIQKLKNRKSHINPSMTTAELIKILVDKELKKYGMEGKRPDDSYAQL